MEVSLEYMGLTGTTRGETSGLPHHLTIYSGLSIWN